MTRDGSCPTQQTLSAFLRGELAAEQEEALTRHLETCPACEALAQQLEQEADPMIAALRRAPPAPLPSTMVMSAGPPPAAAPFHLTGYTILGEIGRGGMGVVYRAYQHRLNRVVAIKMILVGQVAGVEERVRFLMEGELLARLSHPHFVQVYEVNTLEPAPGMVQPYLVLEYVEGGSLKARLAEKPLPFREAARCALVLARAMADAHAQGIVHRDLKPANVLVARDGTLKITDFGLAKEVDTAAGLTPTGQAVGTPSYMAPEQAKGQTRIGPAADVYALGAILYEMLTGRPPFLGEAALEVILQVLENTPAPASRLRAGVPRDLETICQRCLEKEPQARYARAADLADDLESWLEGRPIRARPAGRLERAIKWARRHPLPAALLAFLALSLLLGSAASTYFGVVALQHANEAREALGKEEEARQLAEQATEAERWERYVAEIGAASSALQLQNVVPARRALEAAPPRYRDWEWQYLHSQLDGARFVLRRPAHVHHGRPRPLSFSADGKWLATSLDGGSGESIVGIWESATGKLARFLRVPGSHVDHAQFSPVDGRLITGGDRLRLWNGATGHLLREVGERDPAFWPLWSPDGRYLASVSSHRLVVLDATTGKKILALAVPARTRAFAFSPDSKRFAAPRDGSTVVVWELPTGKEHPVLAGHETSILTLAWSPDGRRLATGSAYKENQVRLWDAATGALIEIGKGHANEVVSLAFSPDGEQLASGSPDQTVRLWNGRTGMARHTLEGHTNYVKDVRFSPDGTSLVSASEDQTLRIWDPVAGRPVAVLRGHTEGVDVVSYSPRGALLASASTDSTVRLWDTALATRNGILRGHTSYVYDVAFRSDGGQVASAAWDGTVRLWDPTTGQETGQLPHETDFLTALAYHPDGRRLAVIEREVGGWLWDLDRRKKAPLRKGVVGSSAVGETRVAFHPGGKLLAWGSNKGPVHLLDVNTGDEVAVLKGHEEAVGDVAFRPDGLQLASATVNGSVRLWDLASRRTTAVLPGPREIHGIAYSADGRRLAAAALSRAVAIWQVDPPRELGVFPLGSSVYAVAFNPTGTRLACACADNTIRLWDVARLRQVAELRGHRAYVHAVRFSPDGTRLASASGDGTVRIWDTLSAQQRASLGSR